MNQIARCDMLPERTKILPLGITRYIPREKFSRNSDNKSFIDQAFSVKMAGCEPGSFFGEFMDLDSVSVHKHAVKELGQYEYPDIFTSRLVNNPYILSYHIYQGVDKCHNIARTSRMESLFKEA